VERGGEGLAKVMLLNPKKRKIGSKTFGCMFLCYVEHSAANRFLVLKSDVIEHNTIVETKNAEFFEYMFFLKVSETPKQSIDNNSDAMCEVLRRSKRQRKETSFGHDFYTHVVENDPTSCLQATRVPDAKQWDKATRIEIELILKNNTWTLVDLAKGAKLIGCKWIFKKKYHLDGSIDKYKARLVAKVFTQKPNIDYFNTFAPMIRISSIRVLLALATTHKLVIHQMDVNTIFLNGDLKEEIYMTQPKGCVVPSQENTVCKLLKSLYGLKQAPKQWHEKLDSVSLCDGFLPNDADKCVYSKSKNGECVTICLYVDDMLIFGTYIDIVSRTKLFLGFNFEMKDMGEANVILGVRIIRK